jgi:hypothetical protein
MALELEAIDRVFDPALVLPIGGKPYRVEDSSALLGLYCQRVMAAGIQVAQAAMLGDGDDARATAALQGMTALPPPPGVDPDTPLHVAVLGDTHQRMLDDGVSSRWIQHAGMTTIIWLASGDQAAQEYWGSAGRPELLAPNRKDRRAAASSSTAAASGTPGRGSTSGTNSRTGSSRSRRGRGGRSAGTTS